MTVEICMTLQVPSDYEEAQVCKDIENAIMNKTPFDVNEFLSYEQLDESD